MEAGIELGAYRAVHQEPFTPALIGLMASGRKEPVDAAFRRDRSIPKATEACIMVIADWKSPGTGHIVFEYLNPEHTGHPIQDTGGTSKTSGLLNCLQTGFKNYLQQNKKF